MAAWAERQDIDRELVRRFIVRRGHLTVDQNLGLSNRLLGLLDFNRQIHYSAAADYRALLKTGDLHHRRKISDHEGRA